MNPPSPQSPELHEVDDNILALQKFQYFEIGLTRLLGGWLPGIVEWEAKHVVAEHLWDDAEHSRALRTRLWELRKPNPDAHIDPAWWKIIEQLASAPTDHALIGGVYLVFKDALANSYEQLAATTSVVYDSPTRKMMRNLVLQKREQIRWAAEWLGRLPCDSEEKQTAVRWESYARQLAAEAGLGGGPVSEAAVPPPGCDLPLPFPEAKRDARFQVSLAGGTRPESGDREQTVLWQFNNYAQEMQAAETLGSILWETGGMPWEFYHDVARHCWDEARHSRMGELRLAQLGHHPSEFPHMVGNYAWRQLIDPMRRFCVLTYIIEAGSFDYKHSSYEEHIASGDTESAKALLYDIIDETMHVRFGKKWLPKLMERYGCDMPLNNLVEECREITRRHTFSPEQQQAAA